MSMDGVNNNLLVISLPEKSVDVGEATAEGSFKGVKVTAADTLPTEGMTKSIAEDATIQTEPPSKTLAMRMIKKADPGLGASVKGKVRDFGRLVVKTMKHGWGELKRLVLKENFKPVPAEAFKNSSPDTNEELQPLMGKFNKKLEELNESKKQLVENIESMQSFEDTFGTSLKILDELDKTNDIDKLLKENDDMVLAVPGESGKAEYMEIFGSRSGNYDSRREAVELFRDNFKASKGYQEYLNSDSTIRHLKDQRSEMKAELKEIRAEMLTAFQKDLGVRTDSKSKESRAEIEGKYDEKRNSVDTDINLRKKAISETISSEKDSLELLSTEEREIKERIVETKKEISRLKEEIRGNNKALATATGDIKKVIEVKLKESGSGLSFCKSQLEADNKRLKAIPSERKTHQNNLDEAQKKEKQMEPSEAKETELADIEKQRGEALKANDKQINKESQDELNAFKRAIGANRF